MLVCLFLLICLPFIPLANHDIPTVLTWIGRGVCSIRLHLFCVGFTTIPPLVLQTLMVHYRVNIGKVHQPNSASVTLFDSHSSIPCSSTSEELLYLVQFDGLLNCEYASAPDSCLAQSEMWWMGRRARGTYGNDQAWKEREILCAFVSSTPLTTQKSRL